MKFDVIAHTGIGADPHMIDANELDHIVIVIQDAVDVLRGVVTEGIGHGRNGNEATLLRAGQQFLVVAAARHRPQGVGGVVAEDDRGVGKLDGIHGRLQGGVGEVDDHA